MYQLQRHHTAHGYPRYKIFLNIDACHQIGYLLDSMYNLPAAVSRRAIAKSGQVWRDQPVPVGRQLSKLEMPGFRGRPQPMQQEQTWISSLSNFNVIKHIGACLPMETGDICSAGN